MVFQPDHRNLAASGESIAAFATWLHYHLDNHFHNPHDLKSRRRTRILTTSNTLLAPISFWIRHSQSARVAVGGSHCSLRAMFQSRRRDFFPAAGVRETLLPRWVLGQTGGKTGMDFLV